MGHGETSMYDTLQRSKRLAKTSIWILRLLFFETPGFQQKHILDSQRKSQDTLR